MPTPSDTSTSSSAATPTRDRFRTTWLAKRTAAKAAAPEPALGSANAVGRAAGRVGVELVNKLGGHPALYLGLADQRVRLTFTAGDALTVRPGQDRVVLRFRPGALLRTPTLSTAGWTAVATPTAAGLALTLTPTTAWTGASLELELVDVQPGPAVGAHAVRVEVEWQLGRSVPVATTVYRCAALPAGKQLPAPRPALGAWWRAEATATFPLTGNGWKTLLRAADGTHLCLAQVTATTFQLGAFFQSATPQFQVATSTAPAAGARRIAVEARDRTWNYFVDGVKVGTVQVPSGVALPTAVEWVGDYDGEQAFGALTDVSVKNFVETFATVCGGRSLHLAVMQGAGSIVDTFDGRLAAKETALREHVTTTVDAAKSALRQHVTDTDTALRQHVSDRHGELAGRLAEVSLRTSSAPVRAWIEGSATVAPSTPEDEQFANTLALRVANVSGSQLSEVSLSVDLGSGSGDLAPSSGWNASWQQGNTTTVGAAWSLASWAAGERLSLTLGNLCLPATASLGPKKLRVAYYGQPGPTDGARLGARLPTTADSRALGFDPPLPDHGEWTLELSVMLAQSEQWTGLALRAGVSPLDYVTTAGRVLFRSSRVPLVGGVAFPPDGRLRLAIRCLGGQLTVFADGQAIAAGDAKAGDRAAGAWSQVGRGRTRDVRIWSRGLSDREIAAHAAGHRPMGHEPGLLADVPLDDLDNTPRNHAWDGSTRRPNPVLLVTATPAPPNAAVPPQPVAGVIELEVEVSNIEQARAGSTVVRGAAAVVDAGSVAGTLTAPSVTALTDLTVGGARPKGETNALTVLGGARVSSSANVGELTVTGATTLKSTLDVTRATTLKSILDVTGATTLRSNLDVPGTTSVAVGGRLTVTGATVLQSTLEVTDATTLRHTIEAAGSARIKGLVRTGFIDPFAVEGGQVELATGEGAGPTAAVQYGAPESLRSATAVTITLDFRWNPGLCDWACLLCIGNRDLDISIRRPWGHLEGTTTLWYGGDGAGDRWHGLPTLRLRPGQRYLLVARLTQTRTHLLAITPNGECLSAIGSGAPLFDARTPDYVYVKRSDTGGEVANAQVNAWSVSTGIWDLDPGNAPEFVRAEWLAVLNRLRLGA